MSIKDIMNVHKELPSLEPEKLSKKNDVFSEHYLGNNFSHNR